MWIDDQILELHHQQITLINFIPKSTLVVLGSSNTADTEVNLQYCRTESIPVLKRYGGGGTVVLYPGTVVISAGIWVRQHFQNQEYFQKINQSVIDVLAELYPNLRNLTQNGLSDISYFGKKIAGTSLFRSRNYLLYQASIIVEPDLQLINNCLHHPSKEPDYRAGRSHSEFMTSLREISGMTARDLLSHIESGIESSLKRNLDGELINPIEEQFSALKSRLQRAREST